MTRSTKVNLARIRYDREEMKALFVATGMVEPAADFLLDQYERRRTEGKDQPCQSLVWHGPGHQSSTFCQVTGGDAGHDHLDKTGHYDPSAPAQHYADLPSGGYAEWTDDDPFARD